VFVLQVGLGDRSDVDVVALMSVDSWWTGCGLVMAAVLMT